MNFYDDIIVFNKGKSNFKEKNKQYYNIALYIY